MPASWASARTQPGVSCEGPRRRRHLLARRDRLVQPGERVQFAGFVRMVGLRRRGPGALQVVGDRVARGECVALR